MKEINIHDIYDAIRKKRSVADVVSKMDPGYQALAGAQDKFAAIVKATVDAVFNHKQN